MTEPSNLVLPSSSSQRNKFLPEEDELLPRYLAEVIVGQETGKYKSPSNQSMKRYGNKIYEYLCDEVSVHPVLAVAQLLIRLLTPLIGSLTSSCGRGRCGTPGSRGGRGTVR